MTYQPIEKYGIIGDMHTVALVGMNGSIDWLCFPHFDSPSVFAAVLDDAAGGHFMIAPVGDGVTHKQFYWPDTNVLITRFLAPEGVGEIIDFMPVGVPTGGHGYHQVVRRVSVVRGAWICMWFGDHFDRCPIRRTGTCTSLDVRRDT
jgi:GH15 family glucan-1,4-alpha-glucosidase